MPEAIRGGPAAARPRERLLAEGARALSGVELVALLLGDARPRAPRGGSGARDEVRS